MTRRASRTVCCAWAAALTLLGCGGSSPPPTQALTPLFDPPSESSQAMVDSVREPEGFGPAARIEQSIDH